MVNLNFSWPDNTKKNVDVNAVININKYLMHNIDMSNLFPCLTIKFSNPNVTNNHYHADMGMIAALKV